MLAMLSISFVFLMMPMGPVSQLGRKYGAVIATIKLQFTDIALRPLEKEKEIKFLSRRRDALVSITSCPFKPSLLVVFYSLI